MTHTRVQRVRSVAETCTQKSSLQALVPTRGCVPPPALQVDSHTHPAVTCDLGLQPLRIRDTSRATDGFSATFSTATARLIAEG